MAAIEIEERRAALALTARALRLYTLRLAQLEGRVEELARVCDCHYLEPEHVARVIKLFQQHHRAAGAVAKTISNMIEDVRLYCLEPNNPAFVGVIQHYASQAGVKL